MRGLLPALLAALAAVSPARADAGPGLVLAHADDAPDDLASRGTEATSSITAVPSVRFRWPLLESDFNFTVNYVDLDATAGLGDWACSQTTYDGHRGNDVNVRDFVEMDEGRFVVAAEAGTVVEAQDGYFDRNVAFNSNPANSVRIRSSDGTDHLYVHFRKWSVTVVPGQSVVEGQPLGLVGSSGSSRAPHVHFEVQNAGTVYEPYAGTCNPGTSLWKAQKPDVSTLPTDPWQHGISTVALTADDLKERPPDVTRAVQNGTNPTPHYFWVKLRSQKAGDQSRVVYRRPDGSTYADWPLTHSTACSNCSYTWQTNLPATGSTGTWTIEYSLNGTPRITRSFVYDGTAAANPTASGFTLPVAHGIAKGRMSASDPESGIKAYRVATPPSHGEIQLWGPRGQHFTYVPTAGYSGTDTFQFVADDATGATSAPATGTFDVSTVTAQALKVEGEQDYVSFPSHASLNVSGALTIEAWIRRRNPSNGFPAILDRRNNPTGGAFGYSLLLSPDNKARFSLGNGTSATVLLGTTPLPVGRWVHLAATWDGTTMRLYVDGVQEPVTQAFAGPISYAGVGEARVGTTLFGGASFRGEIDEVRVWSVARTAAELASGASCAFFDAAPPATLKARWPFHGTASDATANGNNGTLVAGASFLRTVDAALPLACATTDLDADGVLDAADRCPLDADPAQADGDADGVGDACDLCPSSPARAQFDSDEDGIGDACDNCPFFGNTAQVDTDLDGAGDACDPSSNDGGETVPGSAISLAASKPAPGSAVATFSWGALPAAGSYEVHRGSLPEVRSRFYGRCQNARDGNVADTAFTEDQVPAPGEGFYFLVIGVSPGGARGLAGPAANGQERDLRARDCL